MSAPYRALAACLQLAASLPASCGRDHTPQRNAPATSVEVSETAPPPGGAGAAAASVQPAPAPGDAAGDTCTPVPVRLTFRVKRTAARGSPQGSLQAQLFASSLDLRRTVFDSPPPVTCKAAVDDAGGLLELRCVGDSTETRGVARVSGAVLEVEVASGYFGAMPPDAYSARTWARVPTAPGHRFRRHLGTDSGALGHAFRRTWAPIPAHLGTGGSPRLSASARST